MKSREDKITINDFIKSETEKIYNEIVKVRREIHMCPELGDEEHETSKKIKKYVADLGLKYKEVAGTGVLVTIENGEGPVVATRADIDALPILEENDVPYKSKNAGKMHACGHDAHTSIQLGVAKILAENKDKWSGTVKFLFQPAEETEGGAQRMIDEGVLQNPQVDAIFALHMAPEIETGKIGIKYGKVHASSAWFQINIHGVSSHGALPHRGIDAILIATKVVEYLQSLISRRIDPRDEAVITVGSIHGGNVGNIICDSVEMKGTIRAVSPEIRSMIVDMIHSKLPLFVESLDGTADISTSIGYDSVINNYEKTKQVEENIIDLFGEEALEIIEKPRLDVEDFSYFLQNVEGCFYRLGTRNVEKDTVYELHHPKFNIDEDSLKIGIELQLKNIMELLKK